MSAWADSRRRVVGWRIGVLYAGFGVLAMIGNGVKAADRFWIAAAETNWNNASHWSTVSGGAGGAGVPGSADRAIFDTGGAGNCLLDVAINLQGLRLESDYAGVVVQSGNTIALGIQGFYQAGGTFQGGSAAITVTDDTAGTAFTLAGGSFTSTSARLTIALSGNTSTHTIFDYSGGAFAHNNGTLRFATTAAIANDYTEAFLVSLPLVLHHLEYMGGNSNSGRYRGYALTLSGSGSVLVEGNFTLQGNTSSHGVIAMGGTIAVQGNITVGSRAMGSTTTLLVNGSGNQTYTATGGRWPRLTVDKPAGTTFTPLDAPNLNTYGFRLLSGDFTAPTGTFSLIEEQANVDIFTFTGGNYFHNDGTLRFAMATSVVNARTHSIVLSEPLIVSNLVFTGGNSSGHNTTYALSVSGSGAVQALGDFTMVNSGSGTLVLNGGEIEVQGDIAIGTGATGGTTQLKLAGRGDQYLSRTGGTAPVGSWTLAKESGQVVLDTAFPLSGASQDVAWNSGGINLSSNTFTIGRHLTIGAGAKALGVTVADALTAGRLTVNGTASGIDNLDLDIQVDADRTETEGQTYTLLSNNTALNSAFHSIKWSAPWKGTVAYSDNAGKNVTLSDVRFAVSGTIFICM
ncbi:MAG: hypothetical protein BWY09_01990 [Candidatus Hydrogenedentes bacterium ADurb.Bin179]|nr:MAG: hypothetical protein BWY09_01990 [Candidatus Hydrogenedentes bacterium ADurb.Bin179]